MLDKRQGRKPGEINGKLHYEDHDIVKGCLSNRRWAQEALYNTYAPKLMPICMRYARLTHEAEDIMHLGFLKVFKYLHTYNGTGSLFSWMKRVFVNVAIKHYKTNKKFDFANHYDDEAYRLCTDEANMVERLQEQDLLKLINELPDGYRVVFNLFVLEGYKHREIAQLLDISEGTSKSQLAKAKNILQAKIVDLQQGFENSIHFHGHE